MLLTWTGITANHADVRLIGYRIKAQAANMIYPYTYNYNYNNLTISVDYSYSSYVCIESAVTIS